MADLEPRADLQEFHELTKSALNTNPRAPGLTSRCAAVALRIIGSGSSLLIANISGPGVGRFAGVEGKLVTAALLADRKAFRKRACPSRVSMVTSRDAHPARSTPRYGLSVTIPSVVLLVMVSIFVLGG
jgi:hypothetical protein